MVSNPYIKTDTSKVHRLGKGIENKIYIDSFTGERYIGLKNGRLKPLALGAEANLKTINNLSSKTVQNAIEEINTRYPYGKGAESKTRGFTARTDIENYDIDTSLGGVFINLPEASTVKGKIWTFKKTSVDVNLITFSKDIDGGSTTISSENESITIWSNGVKYLIR